MMGLGFTIEEEEVGASRSMDCLEESMRKPYADSVNEVLRSFEFNFVLSDPRLPENPIVYASEGFCKMSGYSRDEVLGHNCRFLQGPDTDRRTVLELRDAIREERPAQVRILNYTKDGQPFWNLFHLAPIFSKVDGTVVHFLGVQTPISSELASSQPVVDKIPCKSGVKVRHYETSTLDECDEVRSGAEYDSANGLLPSNGLKQSVFRRLRDGAAGMVEACETTEKISAEAMNAVKTLVSQLVASSNVKGVTEERCKKVSESTAEGVVSSSLMLSLTRIQQSFVLADPHLPDMPIVHASDLFLHLTGYSREEVVGRNCRFLQGPDTDPAAVTQIRDSIKEEKPCSVRLLNYRKDKKPFWNLLHLSPIRSSRGKVAFYVGVQLQVLDVDEEVEERRGMSAQMKQLGAVGAIRVAVRSLQGEGLRRTAGSEKP